MAQIGRQLQKRVGDGSRSRRGRTPDFPGCSWSPGDGFPLPFAKPACQAELTNGDIEFLNAKRHVDWPPAWSVSDAPKLWQYNLHYHDFLGALSFERAKAMILDWIERCPPGRDAVGWEPYPISLRLTNWCAYLFGNHRRETEAEGAFADAVWRSIHRQAAFLGGHLETHLLGNHLLENGVALSVVGCCFRGPEAAAWLRQGLDILREQLPEQVLRDGGHFERSPMYHSRVIWCLLTLLNTGQRDLAMLVRPPLERGLRALAAMCHPDGQIALLNDSAMGVYTPPEDLLRLGAKALGVRFEPTPGPFALPDTGYYGSRASEGHYLICDFAAIGPDYIPGHAHGDIFSYELSYRGRRVVVDSGVFDYEVSDTRAYCRSTRAHNTVAIGGQDQCEFWAAFRVARRGRPHDVKWAPFDGGFRLRGWHDGYSRLSGRPKHARQVTWHDAGVLLIRDEVGCRRLVEAVSRIHLHPDCTVARQEGKRVEVNSPAGPVCVSFAGPGTLRVEEALYCPEFGLGLPNKALAWSASGSDLRFGCCIAPVQPVEAFDLDHGATVEGKRYEF